MNSRKRMAIFKHCIGRRHGAVPGPQRSPREFWQRAEDRNRPHGDGLEKLGLAEYEAIRDLCKWKGETKGRRECRR